jgi:hypothetical protein
MNNDDDDFNGTENTEEVALTMFCVLVILLWTTICLAGLSKRRVPTLELVLTTAAQQQRTTSAQDKKARKEWISNMLVVKEWASSDGATSETGTSDRYPIAPEEDGSISKSKQDDVESPPCEMDRPSDEYSSESFSQDEGADSCAICLSEFQDHQLVCESNNSSCQHVFHKDCMIRWLTTKQHDDCPMCRETYLLKTV